MVRITGIQEIEFRIAKFILSDSSFEFGSITRHERCSFVNNIWIEKTADESNKYAAQSTKTIENVFFLG